MPQTDAPIKFGEYEVDWDNAELRRAGAKVKLQDQPFQILIVLLEQPGKVVSRETLRHKLWPNDVYVDYERSLNTAIKKLREALEDEADAPRYIETLPRHGYRFIASVEAKSPVLYEPPPPVVPVAKVRRRWLWVAVAAVALAVAGGVLLWFANSKGKGQQQIERLSFSLSDWGLIPFINSSLGGGWKILAISPDGRTIVFSAQDAAGNGPTLYQRRIDQWKPEPIPGLQHTAAPYFSPDGEWIGFMAWGIGMQKLSIHGGSPQTICEGIFTREATWGPDGRIVYSGPETGHALWVVPASGGKPEIIAKPRDEEKDTFYRWPHWLPNGHGLVFSIVRGDAVSVAALILATGEIRPLVERGTRPKYLHPGYLTYELEGRLWAVPFNPDRLQVLGPQVLAIDAVGQGKPGTVESIEYDVSPSGTIAFVAAPSSLGRLVWKDRHGKTTPLKFEPRRYSMRPGISPDGRIIIVGVTEGTKKNLWYGSAYGEPLTRLTFGDSDGANFFSPDGKWVIFSSGKGGTNNAGGSPNIYRTSADGSGTTERLTNSLHFQNPTSMSADGVILFNQYDQTTLGDIMQLEPNGTVRPFLQTRFSEFQAAFSPDGKWVAYTSDESGNGFDVYVRPYEGSGQKRRVSTDGGQNAAWNSDGSGLFYQGSTHVMSVKMRAGVPIGEPQAVFAHARKPGTYYDWAVTRDGERFLVLESTELGTAPTQVNVITNFAEELRKKAKSPR